MIGKLVNDPFVETVKNGEAKALFAQVELPTGDIRTVQLFPGIDGDLWPCKDDIVVVMRMGGLLFAAAVWDGEEPALKPGEWEMYSRNADRKRVARTHFDKDGNVTSSFEGNAKTTVDKNEDRHIKGNNTLIIDGDYVIKVKGNILIEADKNIKITGSKIDLN